MQVPGQEPVGRNNYSDYQLDFYACLSELDSSVREIIAVLDRTGYRDNTMIWYSSDNVSESVHLSYAQPAAPRRNASQRTAQHNMITGITGDRLMITGNAVNSSSDHM